MPGRLPATRTAAATTAAALAAASATIAFLSPAAGAQHFRSPPEVDPTGGVKLGATAFELPRATTSFGAAVHGQWLYVLGGYTGRPHDYSREFQSPDFYRVNLLDPDHVELLRNDRRLQSCPIEASGGRIISAGGLQARNSADEPESLHSLPDVAAFDPARDEWTDLPPMPHGRSSHDTAIIGSTLYVTGGWTLDDERDLREWRSEILTLDLDNPDDGWNTIDAPIRRRALATVALDGRLVAIGGMDDQGNISSSVDVFDPDSDSWTSGPDLPTSGFGVAAAVVDSRIVASAGNGRVYTWSFDRDAWTHTATLTFPRFFHQIAAGPRGGALFLGGISRGVRPVQAERVAIADSAPDNPPVQQWTIPSPAAAKNRQGMFTHAGWLHTFGGNTSTGQHDFEPDNFLAEGDRLSLAGLTWRPMDPLPAPRQSIQTLIPEGADTAYAIGGFAHDGEVARTFDDAFAFDLEEGRWRDLGASLPAPRSQFALTEHDGAMWIFGGLDYDPRRPEDDHFRHLSAVLVQDTETEPLRFEPAGIDMPTPRRAFGGARLGDRFYLIGGMRAGFELVETCHAFDFESRTFHEIPGPARPRLSPELVALAGRLYLAGGLSPAEGSGELEPNRSIEVFDPETERWRTILDELPMAPRHMRLMPFRGRLLAISTHDAERDAARLALIDPRRLDPDAPIAAADAQEEGEATGEPRAAASEASR